MIVGVVKESYPGEQRVALVPAVVGNLTKLKLEVRVEPGAGTQAGFPDTAYQQAGGQLAADRSEIFSSSDVLPRMHPLGTDEGGSELEQIRSGQILIGLLNPLGDPESVRGLANRGATAFALELLPRVSRAQPMDALTSMATVAGYKAVLLAAGALKKMYPMMITAAGTITPARTLVVGAGVAGLQAIATSRRLGAVVEAYDIRPAVKEQVESLGAKFLELELETKKAETSGGYAQAMDEEFYRRQRELMVQAVAESDIVITTAAVPGSKAPVLITEQAVRGMNPGSVIVDLAAEGGGNCELTRLGESVEVNGVTILAPDNLSATVPYHASQMYARNVTAFLENLVKEGELQLNLEDEIIRDTLLTRQGEVVSPRVRELLGMGGPISAVEERSSS